MQCPKCKLEIHQNHYAAIAGIILRNHRSTGIHTCSRCKNQVMPTSEGFCPLCQSPFLATDFSCHAETNAVSTSKAIGRRVSPGLDGRSMEGVPVRNSLIFSTYGLIASAFGYTSADCEWPGC